MKLIFDGKILEIPDDQVAAFRSFAIQVMDAARNAEPEFADCWNVCFISFDGLQPYFCYGPDTESVASETLTGPGFFASHPDPIKPKVKVKTKKKT